MKKFLLVLLVPLSVWSVELHPEDECNAIIGNLREDLQYITNSANASKQKAEIITNLAHDAWLSLQALSIQQSTQDQIKVNDAIASLNDIEYQGLWVIRKSSDIIEKSLQSSRFLDSVDCSSCPVSSSNCCDFTEIINSINAVDDDIQYLAVISEQNADNVAQCLSWLEDLYPLIAQGFGNTTNILNSISGVVTNFVIGSISNYGSTNPDKSSYVYNSNTGQVTLRDWWSNLRYSRAFTPKTYGLLSSLYGLTFDSFLDLNSLNNFFYDYSYRRFPILTNTVSAIHRDTTNYFSFFRGEIGVQGVLEDWQSEEVSGTYYDFLTNHYLSVVFGESLSGYQAEKTNWFSRIETLLAALVFVDESETNAYLSASEASSNSVSNAKNSFNSVFESVSSAPSTQMEMAVDIEKSMYNSLKSFSQAFSSASLPSTVRLLYVYKDGGGGGSLRKGALRSSGGSVDVSVDVDGKLADFIEILRSCSTLCWVFFGLWFMFKFTVWTVKKIYFLIRYIIDFFNMVAGGK